MTVGDSCPINRYKTDNNIFRISGFLMSLFVVASLFVFQYVLMPFVVLEFALKSSRITSKFSLTTVLSRLLSKALNIKKEMQDSAPKFFSTRMGFFISLISLVLYMTKNENLSSILLLMLLSAMVAQSIFNYCIGCKIYSLKNKII